MDENISTPLNSKTIGSYFSKKWKYAGCPFCGRNDWDIACKQNGDLLLSSILGEYDPETGNHYADLGEFHDKPQELATGEAMITIRCRNCNYVAHFDLKGIQEEVSKWKAL